MEDEKEVIMRLTETGSTEIIDGERLCFRFVYYEDSEDDGEQRGGWHGMETWFN